MLVDTSKTGFENLLALVNATNGTEYTSDDVSFGPPVVYTNAQHPDHNTKVVMSGKGDYTGVMDIFYTRLDLEKEIMYRNYQGGAYSDVAEFMTFMETKNEVRGDNVRLELTTIPDGSMEVITRILPAANSWLYFGEREIVFHAQ